MSAGTGFDPLVSLSDATLGADNAESHNATSSINPLKGKDVKDILNAVDVKTCELVPVSIEFPFKYNVQFVPLLVIAT